MKQYFRRGLAFLGLLALLFSCCACADDTTPTTYVPSANDTVATLSAVGDIYLTAPMLSDARKIDGSYNFTPLLAGAIPSLCTADITIGNLEGCFSGAPYGQENGSYPDELAAALSDAGFDLIQTANSYSLQNGMSGLTRTRSVLLGEQLTPLGTYTSADEHDRECVILREINGIRFAFIAFTKGLNGMSIPDGSEYCVDLLYRDYDSTYSKIDYTSIDAVLNAAKNAGPDVIVAALHWGSENISEVSESQEDIASYLFRHNVDVILGSHSHIPGKVEERTVVTEDGREKNVVVAYSLGDFCAADINEVNASLILNLEFTKNAESGRTVITEVSYTPIAAADLGEEAADRFAVVNIDDAIALYEGNYYARVSEDVYEALINRREKLVQQVEPTEEE